MGLSPRRGEWPKVWVSSCIVCPQLVVDAFVIGQWRFADRTHIDPNHVGAVHSSLAAVHSHVDPIRREQATALATNDRN
jgi:hypothetical protein